MKFSELPIHAALAQALAARGYENATPVQAAVLDPSCAGKDLLVSSQTGSGKTIAFGAALADTLLGDAAPAHVPAGLVVVPTRELAVQVRHELAWLLAKTGLRIGSFTGGTPVSGDVRTLQRGVDLVIGTPGRLVDLLRRKSLPLATVRIVILDEADEMLDLGFREDLEALLEAAPAERRTLLLSATLPPPIQALARRFQRAAVRVDARLAAGATAGAAHGDITYVAHLINASDRLAAVVNVLRAAGNPRAIVFCATRDGVGMMHGALSARGFLATAISGDRAQAERDRALEQLRRGDVQVLVATDVAARGLHLPDVDLIVHADLPVNADSLTHRSGRTGRAGRKGTAVVIAALAERRKAERLLMAAHVKPVWTAAPTAELIDAAAFDRLLAGLQEPEADQPDATAAKLVDRLLDDAKVPARDLLRRLLVREMARLPKGEAVRPVSIASDDDHRSAGAARRGSTGGPSTLFRVNLGAKDNADPRWLLP
ncbi:MAG TPA: DEAD/DEAH box helicase, partial [Polyangia bacterium]|nr:DEAD/DEAH box helicase [Polyangia bacterium]